MKTAVIAVAGLLVAGAAHARTDNATVVLNTTVRPILKDLQVRITLAEPYAEAYALRRAVIARTSIEQWLTSEDITGSLGFLCGLQSGSKRRNETAYSYDPNGRFLGAKLSLAFR